MSGHGVTAEFVHSLETRLFMAATPPDAEVTAVPEASSVVAAAGIVRGRVFHDADRNGRRSKGEAGVRRVMVFLDANASGMRESDEPASATASDGSYAFRGLAPGEHIVRVDSSEAASAPGGNAAVAVLGAGRRVATARPLGIIGIGEIRGTVSRILALSFPTNEGPAAGFRVFVDANRDERWQSGERWVRTDGQGRYSFAGLFSGNYPIYVRRKGWGTRGAVYNASLGGAYSTRSTVNFEVYFVGRH